MKTKIKEMVKDIDFHNLILALDTKSDKKRPFVFTNGGTECVAKEDLYTVKTNLNVTEKENELSFIMLPDTIDLEIDFLGDGIVINDKTRRNDFMIQYMNRLRVITYLPDELLKPVKDKRLLALGYAEKQAKEKILKYIKSKYRKAYNLYEKICEDTVSAEEGLTIHKQFKKHSYIDSLPFMFNGSLVTEAKKANDEIYLTLDGELTAVFSGAQIIEEEAEIVNSIIRVVELQKKENCHEMRFVIMTRDEKLIEHYHTVVYSFKDLKFEE